MAKSVKKNYIYNLIYQILVLLIPLVSMPYLSRVLEADGIGTVSYAESIVSYFVLVASLGTATYGQRQISYVRDSVEERSRVFWETQLLRTIMTVIVSGLYLIFAFFIADSSATWIYVLFGIQLLSVSAEIVWFFQGLEEFGKVVLRNILVKIVSLILFFLIVKTKDDLLYYVLIYVGVNFICGVSLWGYLPKYIQKIPLKSLRPFRNIKVVLSLFLPTIAVQIYTVLDKTMIGLITGSSFENGYYEQASKIAKVALTVITALGIVMISRVGYHYEKGETETVRSYLYRSYRFAWLLAIPMCLGLIMIAPNFVPWFFGAGYDQVIPLLQIQAVLIISIGINMVTGNQYLIPTKRENIYTLTVLIGAGTNFILNLFLIYHFQALGAGIASVVAETVIAILQIVIVRKELSPWKIVQSSAKYWIAGLVMLVPLYFENKYFAPSMLNTLIMIASGALVYAMVLFILRDDFFLSNVQSVLGRFIKRKDKKGESMKYDYLVVGAGLYGAVVAQQAKAHGKSVLVIDKRENIAGNVYTEEIEGIQVHKYGAHIFHTNDKTVWNYITRFAEFNRFTNSPVANYKGELYSLPFNMYTFNKMWGVVTPEEAQAKIEEQKRSANITEPKNLEEQAISLVGVDIYEKLVKGYTEKQWGRDCKDLPAFIIKRLPVRFTFDNNYFNALYQGIPVGGYTKMVANLLDGVEVRLGVDYLQNKAEYDALADKVVYTGAIDAYFDYQLGCLEYRSVRFETEILDKPNFQGNVAVNYTDRETPWTRIIEHKWFEFGKDANGNDLPKTVISREYSSEWKLGDEPYYPVNDEKNGALFKQYKELADKEEKVVFGGRLGEYKYYDMDQVIAVALKKSEELFGDNK